MYRTKLLTLICALTMITISPPMSAHNKVVVIPLFDNDTSTPPAATSKRIFQTAESFKGDLGGPAGADAKCQTEADADGSMVKNKSFKAWLSGPVGFSADREFIKHDLPYYILAGSTLSLVGSNFQDLLDGSIGTLLSYGASGQFQEDNSVWTGILSNGDFSSSNCNLWTSSNISDFGTRGNNGSVNSDWTDDFETSSCLGSLALYCIEQ